MEYSSDLTTTVAKIAILNLVTLFLRRSAVSFYARYYDTHIRVVAGTCAFDPELVLRLVGDEL